MSLINKMLNDLEKRDAFLHEIHDDVLTGLNSAYDLELKQENKWSLSKIILIVFFLLSAFTAVTFHYLQMTIVQPEQLMSKNTDTKVEQKEISNTRTQFESLKSVSTVKKDKYEQFLKLDDELKISVPISIDEHSSIHSLNRIEKIYFNTTDEGLNLILKMPEEVDYLVYGLSNPNRIVIEVNNAELDFIIEELEPIEPIVAIRYSINNDNRFKLVLETDQLLTIRKTTSNIENELHNLVVAMDYRWQEKEYIAENIGDFANNEIEEFLETQVVALNDTSYKGELIKTPVSQNVNAYAEKLYKRGYKDYKNGNVSNALKLLNMALDNDASHVNARTILATVLTEQGHTDLAYSILNEGLIQYPEQVEWTTFYARLLLKENKLVESKKRLSMLSPSMATNVEYYALKAAVLQKLNEHTESAKIYRDLLQLNPSNSVWWMGLGISLESLKRYSDALYAYQKASTNTTLASESRSFVSQRIAMLSNLLKDESS